MVTLLVLRPIFVLLSFLFLNRLPSQQSGSSRRSRANNMSKVADEVRKAFDTWTSAWNSGDVDGYLEAYENSDTVRYVSGSKIIHGKEDIVKKYKEKGIKGQLALGNFEVDDIGLENAIAFGEFLLTIDENTKAKGVFTVHVRLQNGLWRIHSDHSSSL